MNFTLARAMIEVGVKGWPQLNTDFARLKEMTLSGITNFKALGLAGTAALAGAASAITYTITKFMSADEALRRVKSTLKANGEESEKAGAALDRYADKLARATNKSKPEVLSLMGQGLNLNVSGSDVGDATTTAIGLARRRNVDDATAMEAVSAAIRGKDMQLQRLMRDNAKFLRGNALLAEAFKEGNKGLEQLKDDMKGGPGIVKELSLAFERLSQEIGKVFAPYLLEFIKRLTGTVEWLGKKFAEMGFDASNAKDAIEDLFTTFRAFIDGVVTGWQLQDAAFRIMIENMMGPTSVFFAFWKRKQFDAIDDFKKKWKDFREFVSNPIRTKIEGAHPNAPGAKGPSRTELQQEAADKRIHANALKAQVEAAQKQRQNLPDQNRNFFWAQSGEARAKNEFEDARKKRQELEQQAKRKFRNDGTAEMLLPAAQAAEEAARLKFLDKQKVANKVRDERRNVLGGGPELGPKAFEELGIKAHLADIAAKDAEARARAKPGDKDFVGPVLPDHKPNRVERYQTPPERSSFLEKLSKLQMAAFTTGTGDEKLKEAKKTNKHLAELLKVARGAGFNVGRVIMAP